MTLNLTTEDRALLSGGDGEATALAMRILVSAAELLRARSLVQITSAHIDGCLYHGDGGVEFAETLVAAGGQVAVPTTLNVGALDLLHPGSVRADQSKTSMARRQMDAYVSMGAQPTFTCAPYQIGHEPGVGEQIAWGESNAIAFANSVLGARTERYGDFLDACCALTGRAPLYGLHIAKNREAKVVVDVTAVPGALKDQDVFYPVLGTWLGLEIGREIPLIVGLPPTVTRDQLKALGASAASTGAVALFHVLGVTPEAPTLDAVISKDGPVRQIALKPDMVRRALGRLTTADAAEQIDAVAVGSPHFSITEFEALLKLIRGRCFAIPAPREIPSVTLRGEVTCTCCARQVLR